MESNRSSLPGSQEKLIQPGAAFVWYTLLGNSLSSFLGRVRLRTSRIFYNFQYIYPIDWPVYTYFGISSGILYIFY